MWNVINARIGSNWGRSLLYELAKEGLFEEEGFELRCVRLKKKKNGHEKSKETATQKEATVYTKVTRWERDRHIPGTQRRPA